MLHYHPQKYKYWLHTQTP